MLCRDPYSILDTGANGRDALTSMLLDVAQKEQFRSAQSLSVVWAEAGAQSALEASLGVGEFDYPALVVLSAKKQLKAKQVGSFEKRSIEVFLKRLALGQEAVERYTTLGEVVTVAGWDGKDGEAPAEEGGKEEL